MTEQLKPLPCPFCGRTDIRAHVYGGGEPDAFMQCHDCSADGPNGLNRAGAIEAWNRRAQTAQAVPVLTDPQLQTSEERRATGDRILTLATNELSDLVKRARVIVVGHQRGSISLVQRHLRISYNTAAKLLEALEQQGVVSPQRQNGQREVLVLPDISGIVGKEDGND